MKLNRMLKMCVVGVIVACSGSLSAQQLKLGVAPTVINPAALLEDISRNAPDPAG